MIAKERVLKALNHEEPDRVPIDYDANPDIDARLKKHFHLQPDDYEGLLQALEVDFRRFLPPYIGPELHKSLPGRRIDPYGIRTCYVEHPTGGYWDYCDFPLKDATPEQAREWPMPSPDDYDYEMIKTMAQAAHDYCVVLGSPGQADIINHMGMLRTMEQVMLDLPMEDEAFFILVDRRTRIQLEVLERCLEAAKGYVDMLYIGEDLGTQRGPIISLDLYRQHLRPRHQKYVDLAKAYDLPVMIHSCGSSSWAFEDFIEMGINVIDTLQPEAAKMEPAYLKKTYGDRLSFHGAISTAGPIATGTVEDVVADCREKLDILKPGGGYCFAPTHMLQDNSPTQNVLAMYDAAKEYGRY